ncbi:MAG: helix-turn-helix transcriptional regulator [Chloroflexi bacterium]|nr:helix-turn-helix transcriptional regulator [Chloroflexota bacterium]MBV9133252.1 helix-turn-helix transcriptional regulator [Chloroflexota bacterium]
MDLKLNPPRGLLNLDLESGPVRLARYVPSTPLAELVEHYWTARWDLAGQPPFTYESLPYPSVHLVVVEGRWTLTGVPTRRFERTLQGTGGAFGIKFRPGGFRPFLGGSVAHLTNRFLDPLPLLPLTAELPRDALLPDAVLVEHTEAVLQAHLPAPDERVREAQVWVNAIAEDRAILRVEQVVQRSGMTLRALQRLFREYVGVSPKWVIQRYRLFEAAERVAAGDADGAQVAQALGYFDQAHFIRDFKAIVGRSPGAFAAERRVA